MMNKLNYIRKVIIAENDELVKKLGLKNNKYFTIKPTQLSYESQFYLDLSKTLLTDCLASIKGHKK